MPKLTVEISNIDCAFTLQIENPTETLRKLSLFFQDQEIVVNHLQLHRFRNGEASVILHCQLNKASFDNIVWELERLPGILKVSVLR